MLEQSCQLRQRMTDEATRAELTGKCLDRRAVTLGAGENDPQVLMVKYHSAKLDEALSGPLVRRPAGQRMEDDVT